MSIPLHALSILVLVLPIVAQQSSPDKTTKKPTSVQSSKPEGLTIDGIMAMVEAGLSDDVIVAKLRKEGKVFDLSSEELIRLKKAKVTDAVLKVMLDPKADLTPSGPESNLHPPQAPQPMVVQTPIGIGIGSAKASGATPAPGDNSTGDLNDPLTPHDSGIYLYTKDREGKPQMIVLERAAYQGAKTGGMLPSAITYGIVKAKTKALIQGPHANIRVPESSPVFYFYFDDKQAGLGKTYFGIGSLSNPNQFVLLKLEVNKSNRDTIIGQFSALGRSSGSDAKAMIPFKSERIRAGLYKVKVDELKEGEYCFLASSGGMVAAGPYGAYGAGAASSADIFDFGISIQ
ncbi:MAG: hypothetical protein ABSE86_01480 [Bryobacteraceae bacterium]|jgi:hypothetical protein